MIKRRGLPRPFFGRSTVKRVLYISSEATPFAASGGLGDVMGALPRAVRRRCGSTVAVGVLLPFYASIGDEWRRRMRPLISGEFPLSWRRVEYRVLTLALGGVDYYFLDCPRYFEREALYGEFDDGERFAVFCRGAIAFMLDSGCIPDVLHANDWQAALAVIYLKTVFAGDARLSGIRTVFTVHNIAYQGRYDMRILSDVFDIHPIHRWAVEYNGDINLMKGALVLADGVTTVSPRYACELCSPRFGEGLSDIVASLGGRMQGILNGVDTGFFDPARLPLPYTADGAEEGKRKNKSAILEEFSLPACGRPLLAFIGRLVADKGVDLLLAVLDSLRTLDTQVFVLGTGDARYEQSLLHYAGRYPDFMRVSTRFDRDLSKRLYAAADIFLMPSRREPCGIAQMIACRYGAVPVVRATGGLYDTIVPYGRPGGLGFIFSDYSAEALYYSVEDAVLLWREERARWQSLVKTVMRKRFAWGGSAARYLSLYQELLGEI